METLLVFLAIIALQMVATYSKQKKEAAKKAQQRSEPRNEQVEPIEEIYEPYEEPEYVPQEAAPIPDPLKEIREVLGLPSIEKPKEQVLEEIPKLTSQEKRPEQNHKLEGVAPSLPFKSITDKKHETINKLNEAFQAGNESCKLKTNNAIYINNLEQGILWTAILQEPRYRVKWRRH